MARLLVGAESNLPTPKKFEYQPSSLEYVMSRPIGNPEDSLSQTYRWHHQVALESPTDSIVDTFRLSPARVDTHEPITLVTGEALRAYGIPRCQ